MKCAHCGEPLGDGDRFCTNCGAKAEFESTGGEPAKGFCENCGAPLPADADNCPICQTPASGEPAVLRSNDSAPSADAVKEETGEVTPSDAEPAKSFCENCGEPLPADAKYCPKCQAPASDASAALHQDKPEVSGPGTSAGKSSGAGGETGSAANAAENAAPGDSRSTGGSGKPPHKTGNETPNDISASSGTGSRKPRKWIFPVAAASVAGIVLACVMASQAMPGGSFSNTDTQDGNAVETAQETVSRTDAEMRAGSPAPGAASTAPATPAPASAAAHEISGNIAIDRNAAPAAFILTAEQSDCFLDEVIYPLCLACLEPSDDMPYPEVFDPADMPGGFWRNYISILIEDSAAMSALQGRTGSDKVRYADYTQGYTELGVPAVTLSEFCTDAFATDSMIQNASIVTPGSGFYSYWPGDGAAVVDSIYMDMPLQAVNGVIHAECIGGYYDDDFQGVYSLDVQVVPNPSSRYGCGIVGVKWTFLGYNDVSRNDEVPASPAGFDINGFVFADSSDRYLSMDELLGLDKEMLGYARNEIFARNGNLFRKDKYVNHYTSYDWYNSIPNKRYDIMLEDLTEIERANVNLILEREAQLG